VASVVKSRVTAEDFESAHADSPACELVRGEVVQLSPAGWGHNRITTNISFELESWARRTKRGRVLTNETGLITQRGPDTVRGIDVAYFSYQRVPIGCESRGFVEVPPELAIEIRGMGESWKRLVAKVGEYLEAGVDRVWLIDPDNRSATILRADAAPRVLSGSEELTDDSILPGFRLPLNDIFDL
jgi:Uma2 family endonuclease